MITISRGVPERTNIANARLGIRARRIPRSAECRAPPGELMSVVTPSTRSLPVLTCGSPSATGFRQSVRLNSKAPSSNTVDVMSNLHVLVEAVLIVVPNPDPQFRFNRLSRPTASRSSPISRFRFRARRDLARWRSSSPAVRPLTLPAFTRPGLKSHPRQACFTSALTRFTISRGVLERTNIAYHCTTSYPGPPDSAIGGMSGTTGERY